jgi:HK97 family phage major capsid protein
MEKLAELRRKLGALTNELNADSCIADAKAFAAKEAEIAEVEATIKRVEAANARAASLARPVTRGVHGAADPAGETAISSVDDAGGILHYREKLGAGALNPRAPGAFGNYLSAARKGLGLQIDKSRHFSSLGEQLCAIAAHYSSHGSSSDSRLVRAPTTITRAPTGASELDPTGGGFLIQVDFMAAIFMMAHDMGELLSRVNKIPIGANSNGLKIPGVDETSRVTGSRWGGVQSYWLAEGTTVAATKPKFRLIEFDLKKLMSLMYTTSEMLEDSTALTSIASQAFSEEVMWMTEDAIFEGTGAGQPLGYLNSPAILAVAKENGQATKTVVKENIDKMFARCWGRSRKNAVWFLNQDVEPQLQALNGAVGTGGDLVYMPPGGLSSAPYATLKGRPVVTTEYNNTLGALGDITLADLSQYTVVDKNGVQAATSMHVAFNTDEMVFRITYRVDGKPMWNNVMTPAKGASTLSPFVALAAR